MKKRLMAVLLVLCMALLLLPAGAMATGEPASHELPTAATETEAALLSEDIPADGTAEIPRAEAGVPDGGTDSAPTNGTCGENLTWSLVDGVLTISGTGPMTDYDNSPACAPWHIVRDTITSAVIEPGVTSIGNHAFHNCYEMVSVSIPDSVSSIGSYAFFACTLTNVIIPDSVTIIEPFTFYRCDTLKSVTLPSRLSTIGAGAFSDTGLESVTIPDGVITIGASAFYWCAFLTSIDIPDSVTTIGPSAFGHTSLQHIDIPSSVTSIGSAAFAECSELKYFIFPEGITSVESYLFEDCSSLSLVLFPDSIIAIEDNAFLNCNNLEIIFYTGTEEQVKKIVVVEEGNYILDDVLFYPLITRSPFRDVVDTPDNWYYDPVLWAVNMGITMGTTETTFDPHSSCTRAQAVTFLWRLAGEPKPATTATSFTDIQPGAYYYDAVLWAVENGITTGMTETTFSPNDPCTRAQIVTFLWRMDGEPEPFMTDTSFTDIRPGAYYYDAVLWAVKNGITTGMTETAFSPNDYCTRAQIVTFLYRYWIFALGL